jgi:hypothetical protein
MTQVVYKTKSATIVDRAAMNKVGNDELVRLMNDLVASGEPLVFVESAPKAFTLQALEKAIETNDVLLPALLEYHEIDLAPTDLQVISRAREVQKFISDAVAARRESLRPDYKFAPLPDGWSAENNLVIGDRLIKRARGEYYTVGVKACKALWEHASKKWSGEVRVLAYYRLRASGRANYVDVADSYIQVGCQRIQRYELEQVALTLGWDFPKGPLPA